MASGTGTSSVINPVPIDTNSSLLHNSYPIGLPNSMGGNSASYASRGGYFPKKVVKKGTKRGGESKKRRARKSRRNNKSSRSKK